MMAIEKRYIRISPFDLDKWERETDPATGKRTYTLKAGEQAQTVTITKPAAPQGESLEQDHVVPPGGKVIVGGGDVTVEA